MSFKVKILPSDTIKLPYSVCEGFNADFDGDEMNIHVPQDYNARAECELCDAAKNCVNMATGLVNRGLFQDLIIAAFKLSQVKFVTPN